MFEQYRAACESGEFRIGSLLLYRSEHKSVLNFPTKRHWKGKSRLSDIELGLETFVDRYEELGISSIAFPQLGCGNGGLDWESQVRPLMERHLGNLPIHIYIHTYGGERDLLDDRSIVELTQWLRHEPPALGFGDVWADLENFVGCELKIDDWTITRSDQRSLDFQRGSESIAIDREDMFDLWQQLRSYGLLSKEDIPAIYQRISETLVSLLTRLPYIERTVFLPSKVMQGKTTMEGFDTLLSHGIRLVPWERKIATTRPLPLFDELSVA